ncbi:MULTISPECIES: spore germination protein [Pontibacillus]|uniref:Spore germination protein n=1 Tax=Pontibacillus chungwhensis TaxID=265426 RepID=A0ABY8UYN4_9BACI|nr:MULTISPECIES: spore germination protein [Pontibacillus]MCD5324816.1 spore germination protein [Pontibacillus sp. HN14]WIF98775.1 spore germination protein [Pontibacillus chungwhensis]
MRVRNWLRPKRASDQNQSGVVKEQDSPTKESSRSLKDNIDYISAELHHSHDLKVTHMDDNRQALLYFESLVDQEQIQNKIFIPLSNYPDRTIGQLQNQRKTTDLNDAIFALLSGCAVYIQEGNQEVSVFVVTMSNNRDMSEPDTEKVLRGSHEGLVESVMININLIRKRIQHRDLTVKYFRVGKKTNTNLAIMYMDGLVNPDVVKKIEDRIKHISADTIISPGYIEEMVEDNSLSPFPQMLNTERPDRGAANVLEGRVILLSEGSSTCLVFPVTFFTFYQTPDDYNSRWISGTFLRLIRLMSFLIAIGLPAFYIAVVGFHFEVIPDTLVIPIKSAINNIAYPPIIEALVMVVIIELIREAGIRLPSPVGQTIGIVGGLVIGDAVVKAGLVSNLMVIVVALTAIASFVVPSNELSTALRLLTFPLILLASTFGFLGIVFGFFGLLIHLCRLESFGSAYFAPLAPLRVKDLKDTFIRLPLFMMSNRPKDAQPVKSDTGEASREWKKNGRSRK